jgi:predicted transcriptional regulator
MDKNEPTAAELEILQVLWKENQATVRFVHEQLNDKKSVTYTTTLKIMQNMTTKGLVGRKTEGKSHVYYPIVEKEKTRRNLLEKFVDATFSGSASEMVMQLLGNHKATTSELQEIKAIIEKIENRKS